MTEPTLDEKIATWCPSKGCDRTRGHTGNHSGWLAATPMYTAEEADPLHGACLCGGDAFMERDGLPSCHTCLAACGQCTCTPEGRLSDAPADLDALAATVREVNADCSCSGERYGLTDREWHRACVLGLADNLLYDHEHGYPVEKWRWRHLRFHLDGVR